MTTKLKQPEVGFCGLLPAHEPHARGKRLRCSGVPMNVNVCGCSHSAGEHVLVWWFEAGDRRETGCRQCPCGCLQDWDVMADPYRVDIEDPGHEGRGESGQATPEVTA